MKHLEEELKKVSSQVAQKKIIFDILEDKVDQIKFLKKKLIILKSDKKHLAHTLSKKDNELVKDHGFSSRFLKASMKEKGYLIKTLSVK